MKQRQRVVTVLLVLYTFCSSILVIESLQLTLIHTNDVHSRFEQVNARGNPCSEKEAATNKCYGGFARLYHKAEEIRKKFPNVVYLSGGDYYQGTVWFTLYKWEVVSFFVNKLNHTAMALGNHEFDDGVSGLLPFLDRAPFPVISANIDTSKEPNIQGKFKKSVIVEYDGVKVGIIGYTTEETMDISNPGKNLIFRNVTQAVAEEALRLHQDGIKVILAVGHAGYEVDLQIAEIPHVDVVVGGHTNTFLYSGKPPHNEIPEDEYPRVVIRNGTLVPVVQAFAFGKYMGFLNLTFDDDGELISFNGNPILLDNKVPQDPGLLEDIRLWKEKVNARIKVQVGESRVLLDGSRMSCRKGECNLGNVIADAQVLYNLQFADNDYWADVAVSFVHSGSIRVSYDEKIKHGNVTMEDILAIQPFGSNVDVIKIKGKHIRETFEYSVDGFDPEYFDPSGKFLQVSGFRVVYDITKPSGRRVRSIDVLCQRCRVPKFYPLNDEEIYKVAIPGYLALGGGGFDVLKNNIIEHYSSGVIDIDVLIAYFAARKPVIQGVEGRITFITDQDFKSRCNLNVDELRKNPIILEVANRSTSALVNETSYFSQFNLSKSSYISTMQRNLSRQEPLDADELLTDPVIVEFSNNTTLGLANESSYTQFNLTRSAFISTMQRNSSQQPLEINYPNFSNSTANSTTL